MPSRPRVSRSRLTPAVAQEQPVTPARAPAKKVTRSRALSADTLEQLGARQLAELMAQAKGDPALARSLRLVLAVTDGGTKLATEVEKRLRAIQRSRGFIERDKLRPLVRKLEGLRDDRRPTRCGGSACSRSSDASVLGACRGRVRAQRRWQRQPGQRVSPCRCRSWTALGSASRPGSYCAGDRAADAARCRRLRRASPAPRLKAGISRRSRTSMPPRADKGRPAWCPPRERG